MLTYTEISREGRLPAPHAPVRVSLERRQCGDSRPRITVGYTAPKMYLCAADLIDAYMIGRIRRGGPKSDANKKRFGIRPAIATARYMSSFAAWEADIELTLERYTRSDEEALTLPGVRALFPHGFVDAITHQVPQLADGVAPVATGRSGDVRRSRAVGRLQRLVGWTVLDSVIQPDWEAIRACREES